MSAPTQEDVCKAVDSALAETFRQRLRALYWDTIAAVTAPLWESDDFRPNTELEPFDAALEAMANEFVDRLSDAATPVVLASITGIVDRLPSLPRAEAMVPSG